MLYILYQSSVFDHIAQLLKYSLQQPGLNPVITTFTYPERWDQDYYIILGAHDLVGETPPTGHYEVYQFEQVNTEGVRNWFEGSCGEEYIQRLKGAVRVYDYSPLNSKLLQDKHGVVSNSLPLLSMV